MAALHDRFDVAALLSWYHAHRRPMPWRSVVSPYRTLVSELMLQQTRVDTVIPYFERFVARWPDPESLAAAPLEEVLREWAGLGYYRRARHLHAAARRVVELGGFPGDVPGLRALPGVGAYTAGAIGSIALGLDTPLVDGNVARVLSRQLALEEDPRQSSARLWREAGALIPAGRAGEFNQALMELGATVCAVSRPGCLVCPVRASCAGAGAPERYPRAPERRASPEVIGVAVVLGGPRGVLLGRRPERGLLAGLWEPPCGPGDDPAAMLGRRGWGEAPDLVAVGQVAHVFTHLRLTVTVWRGGEIPQVQVPPEALTPPAVFPAYDAWSVRAPGEVALSTLARKWLQAAGALTAPDRSGTPGAGRPRTPRGRPAPGSPG